MSALKLLGLALRNPARVKALFEALNGAKIYTNIVVAQALQPYLLDTNLSRDGITITDFMKKNNFVNKGLLAELLAILEEDGYIKIKENLILLKKPIDDEELEKRKEKVSSIVLDSFETFGGYTQKAFIERLEGKPPEDFDSNELRVLWNVALRGDFYSLQRDEALKFAEPDKFAKMHGAKTLRILDFGCGSGEGTLQIINFLKKKKVVFVMEACDVSEGLLEIASEDEGLESSIYFFSLKNKKPKQAYYDIIFISQVLHWPDDPIKMIGELKSYLKPGGMLFGVQSIFTQRIYQIDLFIRLLGAKGFPKEKELFSWFEQNEMPFEYNSATYSFKAIKK